MEPCFISLCLIMIWLFHLFPRPGEALVLSLPPQPGDSKNYTVNFNPNDNPNTNSSTNTTTPSTSSSLSSLHPSWNQNIFNEYHSIIGNYKWRTATPILVSANTYNPGSFSRNPDDFRFIRFSMLLSSNAPQNAAAAAAPPPPPTTRGGSSTLVTAFSSPSRWGAWQAADTERGGYVYDLLLPWEMSDLRVGLEEACRILTTALAITSPSPRPSPLGDSNSDSEGMYDENNNRVVWDRIQIFRPAFASTSHSPSTSVSDSDSDSTGKERTKDRVGVDPWYPPGQMYYVFHVPLSRGQFAVGGINRVVVRDFPYLSHSPSPSLQP